MVQLEYFDPEDDEWTEIVRYDNAHGFSHIDHLDRSHRSIKKERILATWPYNELMQRVIDDLKRDYQIHIDRFTAERTSWWSLVPSRILA
jgi:hypothetical protein